MSCLQRELLDFDNASTSRAAQVRAHGQGTVEAMERVLEADRLKDVPCRHSVCD